MKSPPPKPHVSAAILQLRRWVTIACILVAASAMTQMLVFGFVHYTSIRWTKVEGAPDKKTLKVVKSAAPGERPAEAAGEKEIIKDGRVVKVEGAERGAVDPNVVRSGADSMLHTTSDLAVTVGMVATCVLAVLTMLATSIAGGANVPGVERVVTAATWSIVLAVVCIPWVEIFPSVPIPGVFGGYVEMAKASDAAHEAEKGGMALAARYAVLPLLALLCASSVCVWFRVGVERGIIPRTVSELEEMADREMTAISSSGVGGNQPRALGALYRAIGDTAEDDEPPLQQAPPPAAPAEAPPMRMPLRREAPARIANDRPMGQVNPGEPLARPI